VITICNTSGKPILAIRDGGELERCDGIAKPREVGPKALQSLGFWVEYERSSLAGGTVTVFKRNDGTRLRKHSSAEGAVWWDTGESLTTPKDIDRVRKQRLLEEAKASKA
jgi:hypothetical protein